MQSYLSDYFKESVFLDLTLYSFSIHIQVIDKVKNYLDVEGW